MDYLYPNYTLTLNVLIIIIYFYEYIYKEKRYKKSLKQALYFELFSNINRIEDIRKINNFVYKDNFKDILKLIDYDKIEIIIKCFDFCLLYEKKYDTDIIDNKNMLHKDINNLKITDLNEIQVAYYEFFQYCYDALYLLKS